MEVDHFLVFVRLVFIAFILIIYFSYLKIDNKEIALSSFFNSFMGMVTCAIIITHGLIPILQELDPLLFRLRYRFDYTFSTKAISILYVSIFYISFVSIYLLIRLGRRKLAVSCSKIHPMENSRLIEYLTLYIPAFLSLVFVARTLWGANLAEILLDRISVFRGLGAILLLTNVFIFIAILHFYRFFMFRLSKELYKYFFYVLLMLGVFTIIGSRNSFFIFLLFNLSIYFHLGGRLSFARFFCYCSLALFFFMMVGFYRVRLDSTDHVSDAISFDIFSSVLTSLISVFGTDEILLFLIHTSFNDFQFGNTFVAAITNFVPRIFWAEKPLGAGPLITNLINPGGYSLDGSNVSSYTTGLIAESFINFGFIGAFVVPFFLAFICLLIENIRVRNYYFLMLKVYLCIMFGFAVFYSEFLGMFARALYVVLPLFFCLFSYKLLYKNGS
nr:O-antigen polymerase [uncultured Shewanella sp.]